MKRVVIALGLGAVGVGVWLLNRTHTVDLACRLNASPLTGAGVATRCMNDVTFYFLGFAVTVAGAFAILVATILLRRQSRRRGHTGPLASTTLRARDDERFPRAA